MFVLDTNVVSELRNARAGRAHPSVAAWATSVRSSALFLSAITVEELELGVLLAERRDPAQGAILRVWLAITSCPRSDSASSPSTLWWRDERPRSTCPILGPTETP